MTRETKEQKEIKRGALEQAAVMQREKFLGELPKRLLDAQVAASRLPITVTVSQGPQIRFYNDDSPYIDSTITLETDEWEMLALEEALRFAKEEMDAKELRRRRALEIFDGLTNTEKLALKENIYMIERYRHV
jgi:hypothetical protein